jgi:hypothetical protein
VHHASLNESAKCAPAKSTVRSSKKREIRHASRSSAFSNLAEQRTSLSGASLLYALFCPIFQLNLRTVRWSASASLLSLSNALASLDPRTPFFTQFEFSLCFTAGAAHTLLEQRNLSNTHSAEAAQFQQHTA